MLNTTINRHRHPLGSPEHRARMAQARRERRNAILAELLDAAVAFFGLAYMFVMLVIFMILL